jgi:hypothetical protein
LIFLITSAWVSSTIENVCVSLFKLIFNRLLLLLFEFVRKILPAFSTTLSDTIVNPPPIFDTPLAIPIDACLNGFTSVSTYIEIYKIMNLEIKITKKLIVWKTQIEEENYVLNRFVQSVKNTTKGNKPRK